MPNARYKKGVRAEKKSRAWLEERGYFVVEARGSHGACDLVALGARDVQIVQVKAGRKLTPAARHEIKTAMLKVRIPSCHAGEIGNRVIHYWPDYSREPIVEVII